MSATSTTMAVAVIGVGRMGHHHARIYSTLPQAKLVAVVDAQDARCREVAAKFHCQPCRDVNQLLAEHPDVQAVSVAVPTVHHVAAATPLRQRGIACLIEKPLAPNHDLARQLVELARRHGATLQVGHTERFNPAFRALAAGNLTPRYLETSRVSPMTFRSLDVGVVMDMMIHDLDLVLSLVRLPVAKVDAVGVAVLGKHEDVANARLTFENGCVANLSASRMAMQVQRMMRLYCEDAYAMVDFQTKSGRIIRGADHRVELKDIRRAVAAGEDLTQRDYKQMVKVQPLTIELPAGHDDALTAEISGFLQSVRDGVKPVVSGEAGAAAVDVAERIVASLQSHTWTGWDPATLVAGE
ncbi:MAG: Gfo/Idh/MocA family oxidoreductase [Phycisphaeraceae bacterium]|nr:Gfo/Idh/MocA family oxidoreductase [Phycisphaeraceae bacterium]